MKVNNTVRAKLYIVYPGEEDLLVYDSNPSDTPKSVTINPVTSFLWVKMTMIAKKTEWKAMNQNYASKLLE